MPGPEWSRGGTRSSCSERTCGKHVRQLEAHTLPRACVTCSDRESLRPAVWLRLSLSTPDSANPDLPCLNQSVSDQQQLSALRAPGRNSQGGLARDGEVRKGSTWRDGVETMVLRDSDTRWALCGRKRTMNELHHTDKHRCTGCYILSHFCFLWRCAMEIL